MDLRTISEAGSGLLEGVFWIDWIQNERGGLKINTMVFRWSKSVTLKIINTNRDSLKSADFQNTRRRVLNMNVQLAEIEQK